MFKKLLAGIIILLLVTGLTLAEKIEEKVKNLEEKLKTASEQEKVEVLNQLALETRDISIEKSLQYGNQALELAKKLKDKKGEANALRNTGMAHKSSGKTDKALDHLNRAVTLFKELQDKKNISGSLKDIGVIYWEQGDYDTALKYYHEALDLAQEIGDKKGIGACVTNIGVVHLRLGDKDKALKFFLQGLEMDKELDDKRGMAVSYINIALVYHRLKDRDRALKYYLKVAQISEELGIKAYAIYAYSNMGILYKDKKEPKKSYENFYKAYILAKEMGRKRQVAISANNLSAYFMDLGDFQQALSFAEESLKYSKEVKAKYLTLQNYVNFSQVYSLKKEYKKALEYSELALDMKDKIYNEKSSKQIAEMQTKYETLEKEKEIALFKKNEEIQKIQLSKERLTKNALIVGLILILVILTLLFKKYLHLLAFWKKEKYISQFRLLERIGAGGSGIIYKAQDIHDKSTSVAVKILKEELFEDQRNIQRFKQEAFIIDKLDHPNIIKVIERGEYKGKHFIVMEYLDGKTLDKKIAGQGPIPISDCLIIIEQVSGALALIHSKSILHRDIKPSNIMLINREGNPNYVKLMDFGLAKSQYQTRLTQTNAVVGTVNYMSPELLDSNEYSVASDVYSLGVTFYEMVVAKKPFSGEAPTDVMKQILNKTPLEPTNLRTDLPKELNHVIMNMLHKEAQDRPTIQDILKTIKSIQITI